MKHLFLFLGIAIIGLTSFIWLSNNPNSCIIRQPYMSRAPTEIKPPAISIIAKNLDTPWGLAFLPSGEILVTEREGKVSPIDKQGNQQSNPAAVITTVKEIREGGLLGITLHPDFPRNNYIPMEEITEIH